MGTGAYRRVGQVDGGDQIGHQPVPGACAAPPADHQISFPGAMRAQHCDLAGLTDKPQILEPALDRPDRHHPTGIGIAVMGPGQAAVVERLSGQRAEPDRCRLHLGSPCAARLAVPAGPQIRPHGGIRVGDFADTALGDLGTQPGMGAGLGVGDGPQIAAPKHPLPMRDRRHQVRGLVTRGQRAGQCIELGGVRLQPKLHHLLHTGTLTPRSDTCG